MIERAAGWLFTAAWVLAPSAYAFSYESPVGAGCHERITSDALRAVRGELSTAAPIAPSAQETALISDLPFRLDDDMRELGGATLLIGVRDNDLKGRAGIDATDLATVHGHPDGQREHCLRRPDQDEPGGSAAALADCRRYIEENVLHAIAEGLDAHGRPDPTRRTAVAVHLEIGGRARPTLPVFYVYLGHALHALQDSFTHAFRSADGRRIRVVLNWVEFAEEALDEHRDGPAHRSALDRCDDATPRRRNRRLLATEASTALLHAALDPSRAPAEKAAALAAVLDEYLGFEPDCTHTNRWCDAEETLDGAVGCTTAPGAPIALLVPLAVAALWLAGRRRWTGSAARVRTVARVVATALGAASPAAFAQALEPVVYASNGEQRWVACTPGRQVSCDCPGGALGAQRCRADGGGYDECTGCDASVTGRGAQPLASARGRTVGRFAGAGGDVAPTAAWQPVAAAAEVTAAPEWGPGSSFGLYAAGGVSIDRTAFSFSLGARYRMDQRWVVGLDLEWNPWWSLETKRFRTGAINAYATLNRRFPINDWVAVRTSGHLGFSSLLFDVYGATAGSTGIYAAISFLGLEVAVAPGVRLVLDPCEVAAAVPHLTGAPLAYRQYRFTVGLQYGG